VEEISFQQSPLRLFFRETRQEVPERNLSGKSHGMVGLEPVFPEPHWQRLAIAQDSHAQGLNGGMSALGAIDGRSVGHRSGAGGTRRERRGETTETTLRGVHEAARAIGVQIHVLKAGTSGEIEAAFVILARERADALFVTGDAFFGSRRVQIVTLAARERIPTAYSGRDNVAAGGLMSYATGLAETLHQVGVYTGKILKGAKPADLPVVQSTKFEFVINMQTAKALGLAVPPTWLALADEVIE
jgi:hypothetical protein